MLLVYFENYRKFDGFKSKKLKTFTTRKINVLRISSLIHNFQNFYEFCKNIYKSTFIKYEPNQLKILYQLPKWKEVSTSGGH